MQCCFIFSNLEESTPTKSKPEPTIQKVPPNSETNLISAPSNEENVVAATPSTPYKEEKVIDIPPLTPCKEEDISISPSKEEKDIDATVDYLSKEVLKECMNDTFSADDGVTLVTSIPGKTEDCVGIIEAVKECIEPEEKPHIGRK